jgi:hypothetical protein
MTDDFAHGTYAGYNRHRCRCADCRTANTEYTRSARARLNRVPTKQIPHGTRNGYVNYGCRCIPCRQADRAYLREYRARRR